MSDDEKGSEKVPPARAGTAKAEARAERQARLAAALRQTLRRRKAPADSPGTDVRTPPDSSQD